MKHYVNPCKVITGANTRWSYANVWEISLSVLIKKFSAPQTVKAA